MRRKGRGEYESGREKRGIKGRREEEIIYKIIMKREEKK